MEARVEFQTIKFNSEQEVKQILVLSCQRWNCQKDLSVSGPAILTLKVPTGYMMDSEELERIKTELTEIYVKHNSKGKTYEEFETAMDRDNFMTSEEALEFGLADEIIEKRSDEGASKESTT